MDRNAFKIAGSSTLLGLLAIVLGDSVPVKGRGKKQAEVAVLKAIGWQV